jgi:hypothetical protein
MEYTPPKANVPIFRNTRKIRVTLGDRDPASGVFMEKV